MKNIFKILFVLIATSALFWSCNKETFSESSTNPVDLNVTTYYVQFVNASKSLETGVAENGDLEEIETTVAIALMGAPLSSDLTVNFTVDNSTTIDPSMYVLSANSFVIPAGKTSGSISLTTVAANMPVGETLKLVLNLDAGANGNPNPNGLKLSYNLKRIEFCPLENGAADLVGTWAGDDAYYTTSSVTTVVSGANLAVSGVGEAFISDWWGEPVVAGGTFIMTVKANGLVDIPRQYLFTTVYSGVNYDYEIKGSGKWTNCGATPTLLIKYDIYYPGDADGLGKSYASYFDGAGYFTLDITMGSSKKSSKVTTIDLKPANR